MSNSTVFRQCVINSGPRERDERGLKSGPWTIIPVISILIPQPGHQIPKMTANSHIPPAMTILDFIPSEILEHIAFYAATDSFLGPPNHLVPLLTSNRQIHSQLSISSNPLLYARIFANKFDLQPVLRHLNVDNAPSTALAAELKLRFLYLKRIRAGADAYRIEGSNKSCASLHQLLLRVFIWLLENEEKNERQLREYANIDTWLQDYWFSSDGASDAIRRIREGHWPISDRNASLAMWLYWFLLRPGKTHLIFLKLYLESFR